MTVDGRTCRLIERLPGFSLDEDQRVGGLERPGLTLVRSASRRHVLKRVEAWAGLGRAGPDLAEAMLGDLPRYRALVLPPRRAGGRYWHAWADGGGFMLFPEVDIAPDRDVFAEWRRDTSGFVRFHAMLRRDLARLTRHREALAAHPSNWCVDIGSTAWPRERTYAVLGEARTERCRRSFDAARALVPSAFDAIGHRDVVARNVAIRQDGEPVLFDLDDLGLTTAWQDALTSATWAGFDDQAIGHVIDRLVPTMGRPPSAVDVSTALRLVVRRFADELRDLEGRPRPDGYVEGHLARIDRLLTLADAF